MVPTCHVLAGDSWAPALDEALGDGLVRIDVLATRRLERLDDVFLVRPRNLRIVWNYLPEVGLRWVVRKIRSRLTETRRTDRWVVAGLGRVLDGGEDGAPVVFIGALSPACAERLVLPAALVKAVDEARLEGLATAEVAHCDDPPPTRFWDDVRGHTPWSGAEVDGSRALDAAEALLAETRWTTRYPAARGPVVEHTPGSVERGAKPTAVLFGYGHYARNITVPELAPYVDLVAVHEVEPLQIPSRSPLAWHTSGAPRHDERYDAWLIAGFHHTHAPIAAHALGMGADTLVEKPPVTTRDQLDALLAARAVGGGRVFVGFHRRYHPFTAMARQDLGGGPIDYACTVFEERLPELHWYRWPNSGSRVISNGCHWLDHFLFLNDWSAVRKVDTTMAANATDTCSVSVTLENGAFFNMVLTDNGSGRIGMRDHVELRAGERSVTIENSGRYVAEDGARVIRRATAKKITAYEAMYRDIGRRLRDGGDDDGVGSLEVGAGLMLDVEDQVQAAMRRRS